MTAKDYLKDIRLQEFQLRGIEEAILVLESKATKMTTTWSDMPRGGTNDGSDGIIVKLIETKQHYINEWDKLIDARNEAVKMLAKMKNRCHAHLLWLYYIRCKTWLQVAEEMNYSDNHVFTVHGNALREFEECMENIVVNRS